jgi:plastocyanin
MIATRRHVLMGLGAATLLLPRHAAPATGPVDILMTGSDNGARVWFDPVGLRVRPGATIRWTNRDPRNAHTATAYHPANLDRPRRIPDGAEPWDSDYLMPGEAFSVTLAVQGVYDYYCVPHEAAGMVGRIVVAEPGAQAPAASTQEGDLPQAALDALPPVALILEQGSVRGSGKGGH